MPNEQKDAVKEARELADTMCKAPMAGYTATIWPTASELLRTLADEVEALRAKLNDPCLIAGYHVCGGVHDLSDPWKVKE